MKLMWTAGTDECRSAFDNAPTLIELCEQAIQRKVTAQQANLASDAVLQLVALRDEGCSLLTSSDERRMDSPHDWPEHSQTLLGCSASSTGCTGQAC